MRQYAVALRDLARRQGGGEFAIVGVAPAIANTVYHATGKRVRRLPITQASLI